MVEHAGETSDFDNLLWLRRFQWFEGLLFDTRVLGPERFRDLNSYIVLIVELCQSRLVFELRFLGCIRVHLN